MAAIPALAFLALTKLVLSRTPAQQPTALAGTPHGESTQADPGSAAAPAASQSLPPELVTGARMAAFTHQQATGQPITTNTLADHLAIPPALAGQLLHALGDTTTGTPSPVTAINGTDLPSGAARDHIQPDAGSRARNHHGPGHGGEHRPDLLPRHPPPRLAAHHRRPAVHLRPPPARLQAPPARRQPVGAGFRRLHRTVGLRHLGPRPHPPPVC